jgi:predicted O-linked N-acetylglucosamine transferase (SPINDLY family)
VRIAYLSGDLCTHAVGVLLPQFLAEHDREQVELFAYDYSPEDGTALRQQLCSTFDVRREVRALADDQVAKLIQNDEIDVLIDLHGLSFGARPEITRLRPAPLQGTYLGYMGTTGMPWLDFVVADRYVLPEALEPWFVERPLYVEGCFLPLSEPLVLPELVSRADFGLSDQQILMAAPANTYKLDPETLSVWFEALRAKPEAVLWLIDDNPAASRRLREEAAKAGVDPKQMLLRPRVVYDRFVGELRLADIFLDSFPYNCGSTARDAVLAGLPILTRSGRSMVSRMGGSLVTHTGVGLPIAHDLQSYRDTLSAWLKAFVPGSNRDLPVRGSGTTPARSLVEQLVAKVHS